MKITSKGGCFFVTVCVFIILVMVLRFFKVGDDRVMNAAVYCFFLSLIAFISLYNALKYKMLYEDMKEEYDDLRVTYAKEKYADAMEAMKSLD